MQASSLVILRVLIIATVVGLASFSQLLTAAKDHSGDSNTYMLADESRTVKEKEVQLGKPVVFPTMIARRWTRNADPCLFQPDCLEDGDCSNVLDTEDNNRMIFCLCDTNYSFNCYDLARG